jgi:uncharacterized protein YcbK (DUF882 family)
MQKQLQKVKGLLSRERRVIKRIRKNLANNRAKQETLGADLEAAEKQLSKKKRNRKRLRVNPDYRPHWSQAKKDRRRDELADQIEEWEDVIDRLVERLVSLRGKNVQTQRKLKRHKARAERLAKRRRKIRDQIKQDKNRLTPNFVVAEFDTRDGTPVPKEAIPALKEWCQRIGEPARDRFGPVHITSGFRHAAYNASIGGATNSVHIWNYPGRNGKAIAVDFTCATGSARDWFNFTAGKADGRGSYSSFHHADTRNNIGWPNAIWYG